MLALEPTTAVQQPSESQSDVIEIVGKRGEQALKIDRRTYRVQQNAHSAQKDVYQLLRGVPAVTITPDDQINLLGTANVKVLIDGHQPMTDLHTLHGGEIDSIEIITNPSAQYSAEGTGGIINIVLRKEGQGVLGNASVEASSLGRAVGYATIKSKRGKWTYELSTYDARGRTRYSTYDKLRSTEQTLGGYQTINSENGGGPQDQNQGSVSVTVTYEPDSRTSISAGANVDGSKYVSTNHAQLVGITPDFESFNQVQKDVRAQTSVRGLLTFNHHGTNPSETLTGNIWLDGTPYQRTENSAALSTQSRISSETREGALQDNNKIDWQHPIGKKEILSMSAEWDLVHLDHRYLFSSFDDLAFPREVSDQYRASQDTLAAYTTFQQTIGTWTFMPGVRLERNVRKISSAGSSVRIEHSELFPTLHVAHPFGKSLNLTLSYSKRIDRPLPEMLRPYQVVLDVLSIGTGNPALRDQSTDSYELNLQYRRKAVNFGVIVYNRQTSDVWSSSYTVNMAGQSVYTYVNAGTKRDSGAEFDLSTPIVKHLKVTGSINLFDSSVPVDGSGITVHQHQFRFTGNSTLEWDGPDREGKPGDIAQLQWQHESPAILYQFRNFSTNRVTLSYTHNVTKKWSVTAQADTKYLGSGHRVIAPLFQEYFADHDRWDFSVKLMKTFGAH